jgi:hypothetical protein
MQQGDVCRPHRDNADARGDPSVSDHTDKATADRYTNTPTQPTARLTKRKDDAPCRTTLNEKPNGDEATVEARVADLRQRKLALEAGWTAAVERAERQLCTFTKASQNVATAAVHLDTLPALSTNVGARCTNG